MDRPNEKLETQRLKDDILAEYPNAHVMKMHGSVYGKSGVPDLLVIIEGVYRWVEVKVGYNKPTPLQMAAIGDICEAGGKVIVFTVKQCDPGKWWQATVDGYDRYGSSKCDRFIRDRGKRWPVHFILGLGTSERPFPRK